MYFVLLAMICVICRLRKIKRHTFVKPSEDVLVHVVFASCFCNSHVTSFNPVNTVIVWINTIMSQADDSQCSAEQSSCTRDWIVTSHCTCQASQCKSPVWFNLQESRSACTLAWADANFLLHRPLWLNEFCVVREVSVYIQNFDLWQKNFHLETFDGQLTEYQSLETKINFRFYREVLYLLFGIFSTGIYIDLQGMAETIVISK